MHVFFSVKIRPWKLAVRGKSQSWSALHCAAAAVCCQALHHRQDRTCRRRHPACQPCQGMFFTGTRILFRMFLGLPDPLVRGTDPESFIIKQK
jgi:hypothetical protein